MKRTFIHTLILFSALALTPAAVSAQDDEDGEEEEVLLEIPAARQGYFLGGGFNTAFNNNFRAEDDNTDTLTGFTGQGRIGQMVTGWLGFGLQFGGGTAESDDFDTGFGGVLLDIQIVPFDHLALHLALGAGGLSLTDKNAEEDTLEGTGGGYYALGVSYDWFPFYKGGSGGLAFTPNIQFQLLPGEFFQASIITAGIEIVWWTGLDNNKLALPDGEGYE